MCGASVLQVSLNVRSIITTILPGRPGAVNQSNAQVTVGSVAPKTVVLAYVPP
jgi:hypothetical protein